MQHHYNRQRQDQLSCFDQKNHSLELKLGAKVQKATIEKKQKKGWTVLRKHKKRGWPESQPLHAMK